MSHGLLFLIGDALRRSLSRPAALLLWVVAVAAVLVSGTALFLIPTGPGTPRAAADAYLLAQLSPAPSEGAIARLGSEIWTWPGVDSVTFRFPGESDPVPISQRTLVVRLLAPDARAAVESRLRALSEVTGVVYHERRPAQTRVPPVGRLVALVALVATLGLALWLGQRGATIAAAAWGKELALLRNCGASLTLQRTPLLALGALVGLVGGGVYIALCWALWSWGRAVPYLPHVVPNFPHVWGGLVAGGLAVGVGLGLVGSLIAVLSFPAHS